MASTSPGNRSKSACLTAGYQMPLTQKSMSRSRTESTGVPVGASSRGVSVVVTGSVSSSSCCNCDPTCRRTHVRAVGRRVTGATMERCNHTHRPTFGRWLCLGIWAACAFGLTRELHDPPGARRCPRCPGSPSRRCWSGRCSGIRASRSTTAACIWSTCCAPSTCRGRRSSAIDTKWALTLLHGLRAVHRLGRARARSADRCRKLPPGPRGDPARIGDLGRRQRPSRRPARDRPPGSAAVARPPPLGGAARCRLAGRSETGIQPTAVALALADHAGIGAALMVACSVSVLRVIRSVLTEDARPSVHVRSAAA